MTTTTATVTTAVFPVAGLGTRFLPATKAMPKELMPIIDRPLIQYAVEEAIAAGITKLVFVTGRTKRAIADHFDAAPELERALDEAGKDGLAALVRDTLPPHVHAVYIRQRAALGLGHAVPCARPAVGEEPFAVLLADEFITPRPGAANPTAALAASYAGSGRSQVLLQDVPASEAHKCGIAVPGPTPSEILGLVEKPAPGDAPSSLASIGRYVLHPEVFDTLAALGPQRHLDAQRQREQAPGGVKGAVDGLVAYVMAGDIEEPRAASRDVEFRRRGSLVVGYRGGPEPSAAHQRGDVHARDGPDGFEHRVPSGCVGDAFFWREA